MAMTIAEVVREIQFFLIESPSCAADQLFAVGSFLSRPDYDDVVIERSIAGLCGYPPCPKSLPEDRDRHGRFRISLREHCVYDLEDTYNYCCEACVVRSQTFSRGLSTERMSGVSESQIEEVLRLIGHNVGIEELDQGEHLGIKSLIIKEKEDAGAGEVPFDVWIGPANAIEGYVPQGNIIRKLASNYLPQHDSRKMINNAGIGIISFDSSLILANETYEISLKDCSADEQNVSEIIVKNVEEASISEKKTKAKKAASKASKGKPKKDSKYHGSSNVNSSTSINFGNDFGNGNDLSFTGQDISDTIAKQLENVVLEEKLNRKSTAILRPSGFKQHDMSEDATNENVETSLEALPAEVLVEDLGVENGVSKKPSKLSKPKSKKKRAVNNKSFLGVESFVSVRDMDDAVASNKPSPEVFSKKMNGELRDIYAGKESENIMTNKSNYGSSLEYDPDILSEKEKPEKLLKSSLKTSGSKAGIHSVKWADEENENLEHKKIIPQESYNEVVGSSARVTSAEACAAALVQAADCVASGKTEVEEAIAEAGILILPLSESLQGEKEDDDDIHKLERDIVKWPRKTVLLDTDMFEVQDSWHDTTPEGFSLNLSPFATMWMALFGWINCSSLAYIYGLDESSTEDFMLTNGKEYPQKVTLRDGQSLEIRQALDGFICRTLSVLVKYQRLPVPVSTLEKYMGSLLDTMSFMDAIPSFKIKQWHVIVFLFIEALSVQRLPALAPHLASGSIPLQQMLASAQISNEEYDVMRELILPFGGSAEFSA